MSKPYFSGHNSFLCIIDLYMKKIKLLKTLLISIIGITAIGTITAVSTSCSPVVIVTGVSLDKKSLTLDVGNFDTLIATVHPEDATDKSVNWTSSDSNVATVDRSGNVTAVKEGQATITVTTNDGGFTDTCQVTVSQKIQVVGVLLNKSSLALGEGDSETLIATVHPDDASDKSVTWSSSDSSVATVDNNGKVYGLSLGSAKITVKTNDGGYEDYCDVTVPRTDVSYICVTANADSTLELINIGENNPNLKYSVDRRIWHDYSSTISIPTDTNLYLRGNNPTGWSLSEQVYSHFNITGNVSISGNVMALLDNGTGTISSIPNGYCFYALFHSSAGITSVSEYFLPATTLANSCYYNMFAHWISLTTVPTLPATTLAESCYYSMFAHCTSLTTAPDLPATTVAKNSYAYMFQYCTFLRTAPAILATTLGEYSCTFMFDHCTSLTTVPDLLATNLDTFCCQSMFEGCTNLNTMPALPATKLVGGCYSRMFNFCSDLTTVPDLPATELAPYCYYDMFNDCTNLTSVRIAYTGTAAEAPEYAFSGDIEGTWVHNVSVNGTFYYTGADQDPLDNFGFLYDWTHEPY